MNNFLKNKWILGFIMLVILGLFFVAFQSNLAFQKGSFINFGGISKNQKTLDTIEGTLEADYIDDFQNKKSYFNAGIKSADKFTPISDLKLPANIPIGAKVRTNGMLKDFTILQQPIARSVRSFFIQPVVIEDPSRVMGEERQLSSAELSQIIFGSEEFSVKTYYQNAFRGAVQISGGVNELPVRISSTQFRDDLVSAEYGHGNLLWDRLVSLSDSVVDYSAYDGYVFVVSRQSYLPRGVMSWDCFGRNTIGRRSLATGEGQREINIMYIYEGCLLSSQYRKYTLYHEFGHAFGLDHANKWTCPGGIPNYSLVDSEKRITGSRNCIEPYGDESLMGIYMPGHNDPDTRYMVWDDNRIGDIAVAQKVSIDPTLRTQFVSQSGEYVLGPVSSRQSGNYQELRMNAGYGYYSLSYDENSDKSVKIRFIPERPANLLLHSDLLLVQTLAQTVKNNAFFYDPVRKIRIEALELGKRARLRILLNDN